MFKRIFVSLCLSLSLFSVYAAQPTIEDAQNNDALIQAVKTIGGQSANGTQNDNMVSAALDFAQECASNFYCNKVLGQPSSARLGNTLMSNVGSEERFIFCPGTKFAEIMGSCTSWDAQEASKLIVGQWAGNNSIMNYHDHYAYVLVKTDQIPGFAGYQWFAIGLFSDGDMASQNRTVSTEEQSIDSPETNNVLLTEAVRAIGAQSCNGAQNAKMMQIATEFAQECATNFYCNKVIGQPSSARLGNELMSHVGFKEERAPLFPGRARAEILASCTASSAQQAATQLAQQWFNSPGHKASMMPYHDHYAYIMVATDAIPGFAGRQWFAVGLFADN